MKHSRGPRLGSKEKPYTPEDDVRLLINACQAAQRVLARMGERAGEGPLAVALAALPFDDVVAVRYWARDTGAALSNLGLDADRYLDEFLPEGDRHRSDARRPEEGPR